MTEQDDTASADKAYQSLSKHYEWIMEHVDYETWGTHLKKLWTEAEISPDNILEIGAGTCPFMRQNIFPEKAQIIQSDLSYPMLQIGKAAADKKAHYVQCDGGKLPVKNWADLTLMIYDSVNYFLWPEDREQLFIELFAALRPGGMLLFDCTTQYNSQKYFEDDTYYEEKKDRSYVRQSWYEADTELQHNYFVIWEEKEKDLWKRHEEMHTQRVPKLDEWKRCLHIAGFEQVKAFHNFDLTEAHEESERVHFAAIKPKAN